MTATVTISVSEDDVMTAVRSFLLGVLPAGVEVFQAQANRVPAPKCPNYVMMTPAGRMRLSTNVNTWDDNDPNVATMQNSHDTDMSVQLDLHGPGGGDFAQIIGTAFRDYYGCAHFDHTGVTPLYATDGQQAPFQNDQQQWENRWTMTVHLQVNPIVSTPQDFATIVEITLKQADGATDV